MDDFGGIDLFDTCGVMSMDSPMDSTFYDPTDDFGMGLSCDIFDDTMTGTSSFSGISDELLWYQQAGVLDVGDSSSESASHKLLSEDDDFDSKQPIDNGQGIDNEQSIPVALVWSIVAFVAFAVLAI